MRILASAVVAAAAAAVLESTTVSSASVPAVALPAFVPSSRRRRGGYYSSSVRSPGSWTKPSLVVVATATTSEEVEESQGEGASIPPSSPSVSASKSRLLSLARALSPQFGGESLSGVFVTDLEKLDELKTAAAELEAVCGPSYNRGERARQLLVGDWTLLCTAVTSQGANSRRSSKKNKKGGGNGLPFKLPENPLAKEQQRIREKIRRSVEVTQRIRTSSDSDEEASNDIVRVDNVVEFSPPFQTISDILGGDNDAGGPFKDLKINPLEVKKTKVTLIHDANVESVSPVLRTKISLKSVVLTVAGTSRYLDPDGADVLGLNVPLGDVLQAGNFDTTYVDENVRISRGKGSGRGGGLAPEVLRVFVRKGMTTSQEEDEAALDDTFDETAADDDDDKPEEEKSELRSSAEKLRDAVSDAVRDAAAAAEDAAESVAVSIADGAAEVQSAAEDVRSAARARAEEVAKEVQDNAEEAAKELEDRLEEAAAAVVGKEDAAKVRDVVDTAAQDAIESVKNVTEALRDAAEGIGSAAEGGAGRVRDAAGNAAAVLNDDLEGATKVAGEVAEDVAEAVRESAASDEGDEEEKEEGEEEEEDKEEGDNDEIAVEDDDESEAEKGE